MVLKNTTSLVKKIGSTNIYMIIGNGTKNQFRDLRKINGILNKILKSIPNNSVFLYFGDLANKKKPDVGYIFELLSTKRPDIRIFMIQIDAAKNWGFPDFVDNVLWHKDYSNSCKFGGLLNGKPCSNTKKWIEIHKMHKITKVFILGGGPITLEEYKLVKNNKIPYEYFPVERKYKGDGKTRVTNLDSLHERIGVTYKKIN